MRKAILLIAIGILISLSLKAQLKKPQPLKVKVEFIEKLDNGFEVWAKYHNTHYKYRSYHLVKIFETLPDSIKVGKVLILLPSNDKNEFQVVGKK